MERRSRGYAAVDDVKSNTVATLPTKKVRTAISFTKRNTTFPPCKEHNRVHFPESKCMLRDDLGLS
jgi:hypothetical protein